MADEELKQLIGFLKLVRSWPAVTALLVGLIGGPFLSSQASDYLLRGQAQDAKEEDVARPLAATEDPVLKLLKKMKDDTTKTHDATEAIGVDMAAVKTDVAKLQKDVAANKTDVAFVKKAYLASEEKEVTKPRRRR